MNRVPKTRFPRTAGLTSGDRMTIERDKIRQRRPDDMRAHEDDAEMPFSDDTSSPYPVEDDYEDQQAGWVNEGEEWTEEEEGAEQEDEWSSEEQSWDDETDDEWVFDKPSADDVVDDDGVVWEDADDIHIGSAGISHDDDDIVGPEVELAGLRDVRPRAPKLRTLKPRSTTPKRPNPEQNEHVAPPVRAQRTRLRPSGETVVHEPMPSPVRQPPPERQSNRFARTQATIEQNHEMPPTRRTAAPPSKRRASSRRSQTMSPHVTPYATSMPKRRGRKLVLALVLMTILGTGGWLGYRELGDIDARALIEGLQEKWGLGQSERTAADTPFEQTGTPEEAITDLLRDTPNTVAAGSRALDLTSSGTENLGGSQAGGPLTPSADPTLGREDAPPIPKFKPRQDRQGQGGLTRSIATRSLDDVAIKPEAQTEPSVFERVWRYFQSS